MRITVNRKEIAKERLRRFSAISFFVFLQKSIRSALCGIFSL